MVSKKILLSMFVVLFCATVFAGAPNSIQHFSISWNNSTNQLNIWAQCKEQTIAHLSLNKGLTRDIICPSIDFGQTWLIGAQPDVYVHADLVIDGSCEVCSRSADLSFNNAVSNDLTLNYVLLGVTAIVVLFFGGYLFNRLVKR